MNGEALMWWFIQYDMKKDMKNWEEIMHAMIDRFCPKEQILARIAKLRWEGNGEKYISEFAGVLDQGEIFPKEEEVDLFLAKKNQQLCY